MPNAFKIFTISVITVFSAIFMACSKKEVKIICISGSTTIEPFIKKAAEEYEKKGNVIIKVSAKGSKTGVDALIAGTCDIAMSSSQILADQLALSEKHGMTIKQFLLGYDIIIPIVNPQNQVTDITFEQLKKIFSGKTHNWSELGGNDTIIEIVNRDTCSGTACVWARIVMGSDTLNYTPSAQPSNSSVLAYVSKHSNAIGYISHVYLNPEVKPLIIDGLKLKERNKLVTQYPVKRPLFLCVDENLFTGEVKKFIIYILMNEQAKKLIKEIGFFPEYYEQRTAESGD